MDKKRKEIMRGSVEEIMRAFQLVPSSNSDELIRCSRKLKNELIGNIEKKRAFMEAGFLPIILTMMEMPSQPSQLKLNLIHIIGSLAFGNKKI